jgi:hypothetical protein
MSAAKGRAAKHDPDPTAPSPPKARLKVPDFVVAYIWARAAGRCEFRGCNQALWRDALTKREFNRGKLAHIIAAKKDGPRGHVKLSPLLETEPGNIMLLCGPHHDLVDSKQHVRTYTPAILREYKAHHYDRIERLTAIGEEHKTTTVVVQIPIGGRRSEIRPAEVDAAIANETLYPDAAKAIVIDLNGIGTSDCEDAFWASARVRLADELTQQFRAVQHRGGSAHLSIFAMGPIPLLIDLGHRLDEKTAATVFNRVRRPQGWKWPRDGRRITRFEVSEPGQPRRSAEAALAVSVSSAVQIEGIRAITGPRMQLFSVTWSNPSLDCVRSPAELQEFSEAIRDVFERMHRANVTRVHLFAAVPVAAAVELGRVLQKKIHPVVVLYNYSSAAGGWMEAFALKSA